MSTEKLQEFLAIAKHYESQKEWKRAYGYYRLAVCEASNIVMQATQDMHDIVSIRMDVAKEEESK